MLLQCKDEETVIEAICLHNALSANTYLVDQLHIMSSVRLIHYYYVSALCLYGYSGPGHFSVGVGIIFYVLSTVHSE